MKLYINFITSIASLIVCLLTTSSINAQSIKSPDRALISNAKEIVVDSVFARLEAGNSEELAEWVVNQVHSDASGNSRTQQFNQFLSQFRMVVEDSPTSPFGQMDGFDLLQVSSLPRTNRYFRLTYITYHKRVPIVWEFHFYVTPTNELSMTFFNFSGQNPFDYLSTPDMFIHEYYNAY